MVALLKVVFALLRVVVTLSGLILITIEDCGQPEILVYYHR